MQSFGTTLVDLSQIGVIAEFGVLSTCPFGICDRSLEPNKISTNGRRQPQP
jgi:hypothetical protein